MEWIQILKSKEWNESIQDREREREREQLEEKKHKKKQNKQTNIQGKKNYMSIFVDF